jgi:hypothetical protein
MKRRDMLLTAGTGVAAAAMCIFAKPAAAERCTTIHESAGKSSSDVEKALFGDKADTEEELASYTSHFNFDNRRFPGQHNPPTTIKYRCYVECKLDNGDIKTISCPALSKVLVGELVTLDINDKRYRVVACRFHWKLRPRGRYHASEWARARDDNYIVYAYLVWLGENSYERPIFTYEEVLP